MDRMLKNTWVKMVGVLLFAVLMCISAFFSVCIVVLETEGAYSRDRGNFVEEFMESVAIYKAENIINDNIIWEYSGDEEDDYEISTVDDIAADAGMKTNSGFYYKIRGTDGDVIFSNYDKGMEYTYSCKVDYGHVTADIYVVADSSLDTEAGRIANLADKAYDHKVAAMAYAVIAFLMAIFVFAFLAAGAGRRKDTDEIKKRFIDRIPGDIYTAAAGLAIAGLAYLCFMILEAAAVFNDLSFTFALATASVTAAAGFAVFMIYAMSMAVQFKLHCFCKGTVIGRFLILCKKIILKIPYMWRTMLVTVVILFVNFVIVMITCYNTATALFFIIEGIIILAGVCCAALNLDRLRAGGQAIAEGNTGYKIDTDKMFFDFKKHGENLNRINESISIAVEKQLRSERMKTELITNVSHDIKTPLTSIINYVELLKNEKPDNDKAEEYIAVLDKQAARLKKLTEDIVEASKASTGNIPVELRECSLGMILNQALGEYSEKLTAAGLKPVVNIADEDMRIMADGRLLWRIIDNLLGNICKYAQSGTRVYLDVYREGNKAVMSFKNISEYELNISADELMERFVRGDESRNTEGSGLGLSIAGNLARLQGGELKLAIDGDLFKAAVEFDVIM